MSFDELQDNEFTGCASFSQQIRAFANLHNRRRRESLSRFSDASRHFLYGERI
jgi:hypothetical protein